MTTIAEWDELRRMMVPDTAAMRQELIDQSQGDPQILIDLVAIQCMNLLQAEEHITDQSCAAPIDSEDFLLTAGRVGAYYDAQEAILTAFKCPHPHWK